MKQLIIATATVAAGVAVFTACSRMRSNWLVMHRPAAEKSK